MILQKVEIRFEKGEAIRFISHHDMMRAIQRAVRRAGLPVRLTEGFNPRPRIVFPVALEVGVASLDEAAEIELTQCLDTQTLFERLRSTFPPGLNLKSVKDLPPRRTPQAAQRILYQVHLAEAGLIIPPQALSDLLAKTSLPFARQREKGTQAVDIRAALSSLEINSAGDLLVEVTPLQSGTARPLEALSLLLETPLEQIRHVRVTKLEMHLVEAPELNSSELRERQVFLGRMYTADLMSPDQDPPADAPPDCL